MAIATVKILCRIWEGRLRRFSCSRWGLSRTFHTTQLYRLIHNSILLKRLLLLPSGWHAWDMKLGSVHYRALAVHQGDSPKWLWQEITRSGKVTILKNSTWANPWTGSKTAKARRAVPPPPTKQRVECGVEGHVFCSCIRSDFRCRDSSRHPTPWETTWVLLHYCCDENVTQMELIWSTVIEGKSSIIIHRRIHY